MVDFASTGYGRRLFEAQIPDFLRELKKLNANLEKLIEVLQDKVSEDVVSSVKDKLNEVLEAIHDVGKEAGYEDPTPL